jgi:hypothetical protein
MKLIMKSYMMGAVGACLMAATANTAQAAVDLSGMAVWTGSGTPAGTTVDVAYSVTSATLGVGPYTYTYLVTDNASASYPLTQFEVNLLPGTSGSISAISPAPVGGLNLGTEVFWSASGTTTTLVPGGGGSASFSFVSPLAPGMNTGSALDDGPGPWGSIPGNLSTYVAVPAISTVPESATMIAGLLVLLPSGASTLQILRKKRAA